MDIYPEENEYQEYLFIIYELNIFHLWDLCKKPVDTVSSSSIQKVLIDK